MEKMDSAFALFDAYNRRDPHVLDREGERVAAEYFYALQLYRWVLRLQPDAGEALLLASRCQHIGRWEVPRSTYPQGKAGYFAWRTGLSKFHAEKAGRLLEEAGYGPEMRGEVASLLLKEGLRTNPDMQVMENALCLVFLEFQYEDFLLLHPDEKIIRILKKTWAKMSPPGREAALKLSFSERGGALIGMALGG
jgi:phosphate-selective porin